eukprot:scaffold52903_cov61-Phaeocystis_antarctica.AAC.1
MKAPTGTPARVRAAPGWWRWWSHAISRTTTTRSLALKTIRSTASPAIPPSSSAGCWCRRTRRRHRSRRHRLDNRSEQARRAPLGGEAFLCVASYLPSHLKLPAKAVVS